jgi:hypothetical protein
MKTQFALPNAGITIIAFFCAIVFAIGAPNKNAPKKPVDVAPASVLRSLGN